jgi:phage shock protein C
MSFIKTWESDVEKWHGKPFSTLVCPLPALRMTARRQALAHFKGEFPPMTGFNAPLRRSRSNRMIAGVVAGLAQYLGIDVTLARVLYVLISVCSAAFPGVLVYVIFWVLTPEEEQIDPRVISAADNQ